MPKKKDPFIKKDLRPDLEINPDKKLGELTVRELSSILGFGTKTDKKVMANVLGGQIKRIIDSKPFKDYKDDKDDIFEGPLNIAPSKEISTTLEKIIKRISGLESEIKKLKKK